MTCGATYKNTGPTGPAERHSIGLDIRNAVKDDGSRITIAACGDVPYTCIDVEGHPELHTCACGTKFMCCPRC